MEHVSKERVEDWWSHLMFEERWFKIIEYKHLVLNYPHANPDDLSYEEIKSIYLVDKERIA